MEFHKTVKNGKSLLLNSKYITSIEIDENNLYKICHIVGFKETVHTFDRIGYLGQINHIMKGLTEECFITNKFEESKRFF